ncbi:MAG: hypothetical protein AB1439_09315 [candidate division FCPU426 bacterium]
MKKLILLSLVCCLTAALASPAAALRWPANMSYRVNTMGGATLVIEDETTAITVFNHENVAGVVLNKKENRSDFGLGYSGTTYKVEPTGVTYETTSSNLFLARPGAEYRGLTYWVDDALAVRVGIEGMMVNINSKTTPAVGTATEEKFGFSGLGGGGSASYKLDMGLAFGAGVSYIGAGGKPDSLDGAYNVAAMVSGDPTATTSKFEVAASCLSWGIGAAYEAALGSEDKLTIGAGVHGDDDQPNLGSIANPAALLSGSPTMMGDYSGTITIEGSAGGLDNVGQKYTMSQAPLGINAEAIYNMGKMLEAGLLFDYKMAEMKLKTEYTGFDALPPAARPVDTEQKLAATNLMGITPVIRAMLPLAEDMTLVPGLSFTTWGSGTMDLYTDNGTTADVNDTYKYQTNTLSQSMFGIGCGLQAMGKQLALAVQYETGSDKTESKFYDVNGTDITPAGTDPAEGSSSNLRAGAEFWVMPMLAIRAGFASLLHTTKDGAVDSSGNPTDLKNMTNRISFGAGVELPDGLRADLLVGLNTLTQDPASNPEPTNTAMDVWLGIKLPL